MIFGWGLGRGTQSHLAFLPERHTDFIFASLAEELGFAGSVVLLVAYFILIWRVFSHGGKTSSPSGQLICLGVGIMLLTQVFISVGMNIGILPVTGITLPLVSYGGSSVVSTMIALGIVENIASGRTIS
jgi:rod shape determining protein RodA